MWALISLFSMVTGLIAWKCAGYLFTLSAIRRLTPRGPAPLPKNYPRLSLVVTVDVRANSDEVARNLAACDYPLDRLEIFLLCIGESERLAQRVRRAMPGNPPVRVVTLPALSRAQQLNVLLPNLRGDWIVVASCASRLRGDCLKQMAAEAAQDARVAVVGLYCNSEKASWRVRSREAAENRRRLLESDSGSSASVHEACYAIRRDLLSELPDDVGCVPSYLALHANASGLRVVYSRQAVVDVIAAPMQLGDYYAGEVRRNDAVLRETMRVLYRWTEMSAYSRMLFLTELVQRMLAPCAFAFWLVLAGAVIALGFPKAVMAAAIALAMAEFSGAIVQRRVRLPTGIRDTTGIHRFGLVRLESMMLSTIAALRFPFSRSTPTPGTPGIVSAHASHLTPQVLESKRAPRAAAKPGLNPLAAGSLSSNSRR
ncbi:MAG: glycosyltransferase [Planctomycetes bacterium]|nr:glycosyltransferase [Planctomycetota bacterium]